MLIEQAGADRTALQGNVAVITGAGQGIGREVARLMAFLGASVVIAELAESGHDTEHAIRAAGGQALYVQTDVADPASMERLHQQTIVTFGGVDILVNNAEAFTCKPLLEHSIAEWDHIFAVNLRGAFLGIRAFLPAMLQRRKGIILTMESADGMPYLAPYLASKVGLRSLAFSLAQELGAEDGVWVYCFGAGMVETPGGLAAFRELAPRYGMSLDEFIHQSAPGGHLISAELCATGLMGTILHAQQFHGQETDYVAGLGLMGLNSSGERIDMQPRQFIAVGRLTPDLLQSAVTLNLDMEAIIQANIREYDEQNMFVRPVVKRMFQQGTGMKVEEWLALAQGMTRRLQNVQGALNDQTKGSLEKPTFDRAALDAYLVSLRRMATYITKQESDARGWMRDPAQLSVALDALRQRGETVRRLIEALEEVQQHIAPRPAAQVESKA
jgi:NAD(P)-dependent dehydrogenase (short-subunit alcohol dehydrogenase family)